MVASVLILLVALVNIESLYAVPAKPGVITVKQSDGTTLNIRVYGDEYFGWRTTESGYTITQKEDGLYYYADYNSNGEIQPTTQRVSINGKLQTPPSNLSVSTTKMEALSVSQNALQREARWATNSTSSSSNYAGAFPSSGTIRSAVILVEYSDVAFSISEPNTAFTNQLNEEGYSVSGATGSAKDYFAANSRGQFDGQFDVYGPYTLSQTRSYYGGNSSSGSDMRPSEMTKEAVELADADGVDFSIYDFDNDGYIDNIFVYYAGHNEAEGGPDESVWPHKWVVSSQPTFDGKKLYVYACTSELRGSFGITIAGIGTFCHEFSHVFGLADHYDTNGTTNGSSQGLGTYDVMTSGSYNNNGNTPPLHNGLELYQIGWNTPVELNESKNITQKPIHEGEVYQVLTETTDEYFLLETRTIDKGEVWDNYIAGEGLFITHVDRSSQYMYLWNQNGPNTNTSHECFRFIVAGNTDLNGYNWYKVPYPYLTNNSWTTTSEPAALSWGNKELGVNIINIELLEDGSTSYSSIDSTEGSINVFVECEEDVIYVDVPFYLTYSLYPEQSDNSVTWSSSNTSAATIDSEGCVTFKTAANVEFTATSNQNSSYSKSISLTAVNLQGVRGSVESKDSESLSGATITFYPTTQVMGQQGIMYTRTEGGNSTTTTTKEDGTYLTELEAGYYEVEVECAQHDDLFDIITTGDGVTELNFTLTNYADLVDDIVIEIGQTEATAIWNPQNYSSFKVTIDSGSGTSQNIYVEESKCTIESLSTDTAYNISVSGLASDSSYATLYSTSFTTLSKATTIPLVYLESYDNYTAGDILELKMLNTSSTDVITWIVDGVELPSNKLYLEAGEHTIQAQVVRGASTYRTNRVINVK